MWMIWILGMMMEGSHLLTWKIPTILMMIITQNIKNTSKRRYNTASGWEVELGHQKAMRLEVVVVGQVLVVVEVLVVVAWVVLVV